MNKLFPVPVFEVVQFESSRSVIIHISAWMNSKQRIDDLENNPVMNPHAFLQMGDMGDQKNSDYSNRTTNSYVQIVPQIRMFKSYMRTYMVFGIILPRRNDALIQLVLVRNSGRKESLQGGHFPTKILVLEDCDSIEWIECHTKGN